jgi:hypothetical protein
LIPDDENPLLLPPLNGRALNGLTSYQTSDQSISNRMQASRYNLATAFQLRAAKSPSNDARSRLDAATITYGSFLDVFAAAAYLTLTSTPTSAILYAKQPRLKVA